MVCVTAVMKWHPSSVDWSLLRCILEIQPMLHKVGSLSSCDLLKAVEGNKSSPPSLRSYFLSISSLALSTSSWKMVLARWSRTLHCNPCVPLCAQRLAQVIEEQATWLFISVQLSYVRYHTILFKYCLPGEAVCFQEWSGWVVLILRPCHNILLKC